jgi:hypothetical protein
MRMESISQSTRVGIGQKLGSPRAQRRLLWGSGGILLVGVAAFLAVYVLRGTTDNTATPLSNKPAKTAPVLKKAPPSKAAFKVGRRFIETAVLRKNLDSVYDLVGPGLKGGMTRKQWDTGNIPVSPYPANNAATTQFVVDYSYTTQMMAEVLLVAKAHSHVRPDLDFFIGFQRAGNKPNGRWLVSYWEPNWRPPIPMN